MNRKMILLNLGLLAVAGWISWMLRLKWIEFHQHEHTVLAAAPPKKPVFPPPPNPVVKPLVASDYNEVAQKMLFAKDRNPNVIVEVKIPPPPPPPPPMPALPAYYGMMAIGEPVVVLRLPKGVQKKYHAGEKVGPFDLISFDAEKIVFEWDGKTVERKPEDLREKDPGPEVAAAAAPAAAPAAAASASAKTIGGSTASDKPTEKLGKDGGPGIKLCVTGDDSPAGTESGGYKKKITYGLMGAQCFWEQTNP